METDPPAPVQPGRTRAPEGRQQFTLDPAQPSTTPPVLMWLAGAGYDPKGVARRKGMTPLPRSVERAADRLLDRIPPKDPLIAAQMRADLLSDLYHEAGDDPRAQAIFEADPVVAADPDTGWLVVESMMSARLALFDSLATLLGATMMDAASRTEMRRTLIDAFTDLAPGSQREWCYSEMRLEQGLTLLENRQPSELMSLADTLRPVQARRGPWDALRLFSIAAAMSTGNPGRDVPVADLLSVD